MLLFYLIIQFVSLFFLLFYFQFQLFVFNLNNPKQRSAIFTWFGWLVGWIVFETRLKAVSHTNPHKLTFIQLIYSITCVVCLFDRNFYHYQFLKSIKLMLNRLTLTTTIVFLDKLFQFHYLCNFILL